MELVGWLAMSVKCNPYCTWDSNRTLSVFSKAPHRTKYRYV